MSLQPRGHLTKDELCRYPGSSVITPALPELSCPIRLGILLGRTYHGRFQSRYWVHPSSGILHSLP